MVLTVTRLHLRAAVLVLSSAVATAQQPAVQNPSRARPLLFGFALACTYPICEPGMRGRVGGPGNAGAASGPTDLKYPQVIAVAPGTAAERAGIRPGDVLQTIDGLSLLSAQGTERMARAAAGERVQLGFDRHGKPMSFILELGLPSASARDVSKVLAGYMAIQGNLHGDLRTEIWSDQPIYAFPDSVTGRVTFQIGTSTIVTMKYIKDSTDRASKPDSMVAGAQKVATGSCAAPDSVAIRGAAKAATEEQIRSDIGIKPKSVVNSRVLNSAIKNLYATNLFDDIHTDCETIAGKTVLVFTISERRTLIDSSAGPDEVSASSVRERIDLIVGEPIDPSQNAKDVAHIDSLYQSEDYYVAKGRVDTINERETTTLVFHIDE